LVTIARDRATIVRLSIDYTRAANLGRDQICLFKSPNDRRTGRAVAHSSGNALRSRARMAFHRARFASRT
jgi:hypothetical protein